ncbi:ThuA-like domain-containing protein [Dichotomopilus funicola]|uniref:ThuA-like domain-containing protein n=1 Tax=Dichotomopilus funicola TaxID=1934379 RepID=A0AAN6UU46_9PEZI|nr:ThuA-like domain-containing protein [Dichotomopilus funicola]
MSNPQTTTPFKILIFSRTTAYRHASIPAGIHGLRRLGPLSTPTFEVDATEDPARFTPSSLSTYRVIVLLQCSGEIFDDEAQLDAFKGFVWGGGGVVGVHCASFAMESSDWYARLIGAVFANHPVPQWGKVKVLEPGHAIMRRGVSLGGGGGQGEEGDIRKGDSKTVDTSEVRTERTWMDEWYNFKTHPRETKTEDGKGLHVLLTVDEASYEGGTHGEDHPLVWCQELEGGRCFYTALGHFDEAYEDDWFMGQLLGGILWAGGFATDVQE